tara:strand:+ start:637 stop:846 length:210 start_codon:yes stop_codon:yes gene_type:complete
MIEMDDVLAHAIIPLLDARAVLFQHYLELDRRVKRAASQDEVCMRINRMPHDLICDPAIVRISNALAAA